MKWPGLGRYLRRFRCICAGKFAAEMDEVLGPQAPAVLGLKYRRAQRHGLASRAINRLEASRPQRIEDGCDAGRGDLRIMRHDRRDGRPGYAGARHVVALKMIGMKLDEAWNQIVTVNVLGRCRNISGDHFEDLAVANDHCPLKDARRGQW